MIDINEIKKGTVIKVDDQFYQVVEFLHVKPGKGAAIMKTKLKNVHTGATLERNFNSNLRVEEAQIFRTIVQYLYKDGDTYYFMDNNTYETIEIPEDKIGDDKYYLIDNLEVYMATLDGQLLGITVPEKLELTVTSIDPASVSGSNTGASKEATLETGLKVRVPLFINEGEKIIVSTAKGEYYSRA